ncbi:MAG TPA: hypothetical protein VJS68_02690, partial [Thermoplasmata archaeon]|nr:hypothetical protein [Thermoplasmata archaeon]
VQFNLTIWGGVPPFAVLWEAPANSSLHRLDAAGEFPVSVSFRAAGNVSASVILTDREGVPAQAVADPVSIANPPTLSLASVPAALELGEPVFWSAGIVGGSPPLTWLAESTLPTAQNQSVSGVANGTREISGTWNITAPGTGRLSLLVWDAAGGLAVWQSDVEVHPSLALSVQSSRAALSGVLGANVTLGVWGGWGPYAYTVSLSDGEAFHGTLPGAGSTTVGVQLQSDGPISGWVSISDALNFRVSTGLFIVGNSSWPPPNGVPTSLPTNATASSSAWIVGGGLSAAFLGFLAFRSVRAWRSRRSPSPEARTLATLKSLLQDREGGVDEDSVYLLTEDQGLDAAQTRAAIAEWERQGRITRTEDPTLGTVYRWSTGPAPNSTASTPAPEGGSA